MQITSRKRMIKPISKSAKTRENLYKKKIELENINRQLETQRDLAIALGATLNLNDALSLCLKAAIEVSGLDSGGIYLVEECGGLRLTVTYGLTRDYVEQVSYYEVNTDNVKLAEKGIPIYAQYEQYETYGFKENPAVKKEGIKSIGIIPIKTEERLIGCLNVVSHAKCDIPVATRNVLEFVAAQISIAIARIKAEEEFRKSEIKYKNIIEQSIDGVMLVNDLGEFIEWNKGMEKIFGIKKKDVIGKPVYGFKNRYKNSNSSNDRRYRKILTYLQTGEWPFPNRINEKEFTNMDGVRKTIQEIVFPINIDGRHLFSSIIRDVTEVNQTKEKLEQTNSLLSIAFNDSPQWLTITSLDEGIYIKVNGSFCRMMGFSREEAIGNSAIGLGIWCAETREEFIKVIKEHGEIRNFEATFCTKDGKTLQCLVSSKLVYLERKPCLISMVADITEKKKYESEIERLDRLNLIGELAASIGHEIRNPMTTVRGFLQMLGSKEEFIGGKEYFDLMIDELDRANQIISEFLSLAKNKSIKLERHNLNDIIETIYPLIHANATLADINVFLVLKGVPNLPVDEKEIRQLILNLSRNGIEAMKHGGNLTISTSLEGVEVILKVSDEGPGIDSTVLEKIGSPFFTTKDNGTGLGLAVCYSIASRHTAKIDVETGPEGTTFNVRFRIQQGN